MAETTGTPTPKTRSKTAKPAAKKADAAPATAAKPVARKPQEKKTVTKPAAPAKAVRKRATATTISAEERQRMIAEAAYLRAELRNFVGGDPVTDWLEAEADVNASLKGPTH